MRADDGTPLFERQADRALAPASNAKVLTALAALATFGPTYRFTTRIYANAPPDETGTVATLAVLGGGDAALTSEGWWRLAADLKRQGLRRVRGELILDDSLFDRQRWNPAWDTVSARAYHAPVGALTANYGAFAVEVRTAKSPGAPLSIAIDPDVPYLQLVNQARAGSAKAPASLSIERKSTGDREQVLMSGTLPAGTPAKIFYRSVIDPVRYAGAVFRMQLTANGIVVEGGNNVGTVPDDFHEILAFEGKPLGEIVRLFVKHSNNNIAESLVKAMGAQANGAPGTWEDGSRAMRQRLTDLGLDPKGYTLVDGSGLARSDRVTPRTLVEALRIARSSFLFGPELVAALPIAARDGTMKKRAADAIDAVRAKTGLLSGVTGLSGYARLHDGVDVVFSILANGYQASDAQAMTALDAFVSALVTSTGKPAKLGGDQKGEE